MDLQAGRLLHLVTPEDKVVTPDDPRFALEAFRFVPSCSSGSRSGPTRPGATAWWPHDSS